MNEILGFPSPYGELHFSMQYLMTIAPSIVVSVPLRGITFLNATVVPFAFPDLVSVPLRGITFLNQICREYEIDKDIVSVPLRGITFLNNMKPNYETCQHVFPSPYGELHFSIKTCAALLGFELVSVPLRGITFLNPVPGTLVIKWVSGT